MHTKAAYERAYAYKLRLQQLYGMGPFPGMLSGLSLWSFASRPLRRHALSTEKTEKKESSRSFDVYGASKELPSTWAGALLFLLVRSPEAQARVADLVCVMNAHDPAFNDQQLAATGAAEEDPLRDPRRLNLTAIGNLAFMATHPHVPVHYRERWAKLLRRVRQSVRVYLGRCFLTGIVTGAGISMMAFCALKMI